MTLYRIYRLDPAGHITDAFPVECRSDDVALNAARWVWQWAASVEVWEGSRRIARLAPDRLRTHWTGRARCILLDRRRWSEVLFLEPPAAGCGRRVGERTARCPPWSRDALAAAPAPVTGRRAAAAVTPLGGAARRRTGTPIPARVRHLVAFAAAIVAAVGLLPVTQQKKKRRRFGGAAKFREETSKKADSAVKTALLRCTN